MGDVRALLRCQGSNGHDGGGKRHSSSPPCENPVHIPVYSSDKV